MSSNFNITNISSGIHRISTRSNIKSQGSVEAVGPVAATHNDQQPHSTERLENKFLQSTGDRCHYTAYKAIPTITQIHILNIIGDNNMEK